MSVSEIASCAMCPDMHPTEIFKWEYIFLLFFSFLLINVKISYFEGTVCQCSVVKLELGQTAADTTEIKRQISKETKVCPSFLIFLRQNYLKEFKQIKVNLRNFLFTS